MGVNRECAQEIEFSGASLRPFPNATVLPISSAPLVGALFGGFVPPTLTAFNSLLDTVSQTVDPVRSQATSCARSKERLRQEEEAEKRKQNRRCAQAPSVAHVFFALVKSLETLSSAKASSQRLLSKRRHLLRPNGAGLWIVLECRRSFELLLMPRVSGRRSSP